MNKLLLILVSMVSFTVLNAQEKKLNIIAIGAHPDDCDSKFGGTAALFAKMGHNVKFLALTSGDAGHQSEGGGALGNRRSPNDYHPDHRNAGKVVIDASYMVIVPNVCPDTPPLSKNPLFIYMQDRFEKPYRHQPDLVVAIDETIELKIDGLHAHTSQMYEWLPWTNGGDASVAKIPTSPEERRAWLANRIKNRSGSMTPEKQAALVKWYGAKKAKKIKYIESFEVAEYGMQPTEEDLRSYFPMLKE
jgi:LmbE family N-acetylglucosaminyl deacetylase